MIAWKVVSEKAGKRVSVFAGDYAVNQTYELEYRKGEIVKARENSLGIFCFVSKEKALEWTRASQAIKVEGMNRKRVPKKVCAINCDFDDWYEGKANNDKPGIVPTGTVCFEKVLVLE